MATDEKRNSLKDSGNALAPRLDGKIGSEKVTVIEVKDGYSKIRYRDGSEVSCPNSQLVASRK
jgi:hypothetical protein